MLHYTICWLLRNDIFNALTFLTAQIDQY